MDSHSANQILAIPCPEYLPVNGTTIWLMPSNTDTLLTKHLLTITSWKWLIQVCSTGSELLTRKYDSFVMTHSLWLIHYDSILIIVYLVKWLSKKTLGDYEPASLVYDATEHQWEKKLKNRITNGAVSPLAQYDRMLSHITRWHICANERDILHDEAEMLFNRLKKVKGTNCFKFPKNISKRWNRTIDLSGAGRGVTNWAVLME